MFFRDTNMRQRERVLRVAAETAEKMGLDPQNKEAIDSILFKKDLPIEKSFSSNDNKEENKEDKNQEMSPEEEKLSPPKKKNPFPPKKKKAIENAETTVANTTVE